MPSVSAAVLEQTTFVPPANFAEFLERFPTYVRNWLRFKRCPEALIEDFEQDLLMYLMRVGPVNRARGVPDRVALYSATYTKRSTEDSAKSFVIRNPHGHWGAYINLVLGREWKKLIILNKKAQGYIKMLAPVEWDVQGNPTKYAMTLAPMCIPESVLDYHSWVQAIALHGGRSGEHFDRFLGSIQGPFSQRPFQEVTTQMYVKEFFTFLQWWDPSLIEPARIFMQSESLADAARTSEIGVSVFKGHLERLKRASVVFRSKFKGNHTIIQRSEVDAEEADDV